MKKVKNFICKRLNSVVKHCCANITERSNIANLNVLYIVEQKIRECKKWIKITF